MSTPSVNESEIKRAVRDTYGRAASRAGQAGARSCCQPGSCGCDTGGDAITRDLYGRDQTAGLPDAAVQASLGCGNPTMLADLEPGQTVLDLGAGGGIDVLLSARRVGPQGFVYGLDMTPEMLKLARRNQREARVENVDFLEGDIEAIPLPDRSVDVIISNCVINLSTDKTRVLSEAFRVLRPGGRLAVSDIVSTQTRDLDHVRDLDAWAGCVAGALAQDDYRARLDGVGFEQIEIEPTRVHEADPAGQPSYFSAFIRARKPAVS